MIEERGGRGVFPPGWRWPSPGRLTPRARRSRHAGLLTRVDGSPSRPTSPQSPMVGVSSASTGRSPIPVSWPGSGAPAPIGRPGPRFANCAGLSASVRPSGGTVLLAQHPRRSSTSSPASPDTRTSGYELSEAETKQRARRSGPAVSRYRPRSGVLTSWPYRSPPCRWSWPAGWPHRSRCGVASLPRTSGTPASAPRPRSSPCRRRHRRLPAGAGCG